ncbi:MAG TPA: sigma-70 family RNA polymerase sigma factor [Opitutales bacterium]|nr:sigma-70 family RNA polymerase sigma factor [Opitutales bacterium]
MSCKDLTADKLLLERFREGDERAFTDIVHRYREPIFRRVFGMLKNHEDAEEVTQDTFLRARRGLENFRGDAAFSTWLYQIATNLAHNRYWFWWRRGRHAAVSLDATTGPESDLTLADVLPDEDPDPGKKAVTQELVHRVEAAMERLSPAHREILALRNVKDLSYEEIAALLDLSLGTVKSRIARAREALKQVLSEQAA